MRLVRKQQVIGSNPITGSLTNPHEFRGCSLHGLAGLVCFVSLAVACFVLARRFAGDARWRGWAVYSILTGVVVVLFFIASNVTSVLDMRGVWPNAPTGLLQRIAIVAGWGWIALLATRLSRDVRSGADARP